MRTKDFRMEVIDVFCTEWMKKTQKEKETFINERNAFEKKMAYMNSLGNYGKSEL